MAFEYEYLLHLTGAFLKKQAPEVREGLDWSKLGRMAQIHGVAGILGAMAAKYPICPEPGYRAELRSLCHRTVETFTHRGLEAEALLRLLNQAQVDHVLMKGYVVRDYYPVPELRTFGDIDILIRTEDRQKVHNLMTAAGFQTKVDWEPIFSYTRGREFYEIHTRIMEVDVSDRADYRGYFDRAWEFARREKDFTWQLTPEFHFLYLLTHIAKHIGGSGAGARLYLDLAAFVLRFGGSVDWLWITGELKQLQLWRFGCVVFTAVEDWFGVEMPFAFERAREAVMSEFLVYTMDAGVFGQHNREVSLVKLKRDESSGFFTRLKLLLRRIFPSAASIQTRYTYLRRRPWLLPVAWIHRFVITRQTLGAHAHEAQSIFRADSGEVSRLHRLMGDIGL